MWATTTVRRSFRHWSCLHATAPEKTYLLCSMDYQPVAVSAGVTLPGLWV